MVGIIVCSCWKDEICEARKVRNLFAWCCQNCNFWAASYDVAVQFNGDLGWREVEIAIFSTPVAKYSSSS